MPVCQCPGSALAAPDSRLISLSTEGISCQLFSSIEEAAPLWEPIAPGDNVFLQVPYLRVVEQAQPEGIVPVYAVFLKNGRPFGLAYLQIIDFRTDKHLQTPAPNSFFGKVAHGMRRHALSLLRFRLLHLGNVLLTGPRGYYFLPETGASEVHRLLSDALPVISRELGQSIKGYLIKDIPSAEAVRAEVWAEKGYEELCFFPNMLFHLDPAWRHFDDYLGSLHSKYRVRARRAFRLLDGVRTRELDIEEIQFREADLNRLYREIAESVEFNMADLHPGYFQQLKAEMGDAFHLVGYFLEGKLVGFYTMIENGEELEAHFIGFDQAENRDKQLYLNMLFDMIRMGIDLKVRYISFARTAMEIKSSVGAVPEQLKCYIQHRSPAVHSLIRPLVRFLQPKLDWEPRHPFK